jgi:hypothetical protein
MGLYFKKYGGFPGMGLHFKKHGASQAWDCILRKRKD